MVQYSLFVSYYFIGLSLVWDAEEARLELGCSLEMRLSKDRFDVVAKAQIVDEVRVSNGLVVVLESAQFRVLQTEVAEVE